MKRAYEAIPALPVAGAVAALATGQMGWALLFAALAVLAVQVDRLIAAVRVNEQHAEDLHEVRMVLAQLGDPDELLKRLEETRGQVEKLQRLPERLDELTAKVQKLVGDANERFGKLEAFNNKLLTGDALRSRVTFGRE